MDRKHILIVANQTANGEHLRRVVAARTAEGPCRFTLVVPAYAPDGLTWTEAESLAQARNRIDEALPGLCEIAGGADAAFVAVVGDRRPMVAIEDALRSDPAQEIIVSTFPIGVSGWLRQDLPHRVKRTYDVVVTHVVDERVDARG